ncbi:GAF and ANTAR domain-containing protein [Winogradskya humida]|uniref:GAF domain-containing protein n=1 Tax=Winogradskya humida TaxID=113566 RepID=A0ABQ4A5Z5_9ACTN|nr:GAF and ANTAR domain-containing protein [Actinoplanes humidus]GIE26033.1 GAF domain-containing protein [Actinoplanes humidus]
MEDRSAIITDLITRQAAAHGDRPGFLRGVCGAAAEVLSASGAGISIMTDDGTRGETAASDSACERIEELQFILGEGPCMDAFTSRRPVLVPDLGDPAPDAGGRWPFYTPAASAGGLRAVFAFPLQIGAARLGVLDVFRDRPGPLTAGEFADALTVADVTVAALLDRHVQARDGLVREIDDNNYADGYRAQLFQAQGMVMVQLGVSLAEAMARIRAHAYAQERRLSDVARDIVARRLHFDTDKP